MEISAPDTCGPSCQKQKLPTEEWRSFKWANFEKWLRMNICMEHVKKSRNDHERMRFGRAVKTTHELYTIIILCSSERRKSNEQKRWHGSWLELIRQPCKANKMLHAWHAKKSVQGGTTALIGPKLARNNPHQLPIVPGSHQQKHWSTWWQQCLFIAILHRKSCAPWAVGAFTGQIVPA